MQDILHLNAMLVVHSWQCHTVCLQRMRSPDVYRVTDAYSENKINLI